MFHLWVKPRPPVETGRLTPPHAVDSSATIITPGYSDTIAPLTSRRKAMASMFSRPPYAFGTHSPCLRE
jgi:hypothetical protein